MKDYNVSKLQIKYYNTDASRKKQNKSQKMDEPFLHFEIKTNGQVHNESKFRH